MHGNSSFGAGYRCLDHAGAPALLEYLDTLAEIPAVRHAKRAASEALMLAPGHHVLDIGCGSGVDLPDLAAQVSPGGMAFGVDPSERALEAARRRVAGAGAIELVRATAERLPFADARLDACRADRALQHVLEPEAALAEMRRVLCVGGRVVVLEMLSYLDEDTVDEAMSTLVSERLWSGTGQAWLPYMLPLLMRRAGFGAPEIRTTHVVSSRLDDADRALRIRATLADEVAAGALDQLRAASWLEDLIAAEGAGADILRMHFVQISAAAV